MGLRQALLALFASATCGRAAAAPLPEEAAAVEEALAEGDECALAGGLGDERARCALNALQRRRLLVTSASSADTSANSSADASSGERELQIGEWQTSGVCARIITVEDCKALAAQLWVPFSRTHCEGIACAPGGCYQYRSPGQANNLHVYWNPDKVGLCSTRRQCICDRIRYPVASGYAPPASMPYGYYVPLTQVPGPSGDATTPLPEAQAAAGHGQIVTVYHQTSYWAGVSILRSHFHRGTHGICGGAIYFATSPRLTDIKIVGGMGFMIEAQVDLGRVKWMPPRCDPHMTGSKLRSMGYDSIRLDRSHYHECKDVSPCGEVVIYDSSRVKSMKGYPWAWTNGAGLKG